MPGQASYGTIPAMDIEPTATAIIASPSGMTMVDWYTSKSVSRATAFRLATLLDLKLGRMRVAGIRTPVAWLEQHEVEAMNRLAQELANGATLGILKARMEAALAPLEPDANLDVKPHQASLSQSQEPPQDGLSHGATIDIGEALEARLRTGKLALETRLPMSTNEVAWLLQARPGAAVVRRGGVIARRQARNVWTLEAAAWPEPPQAGLS
jgi:hypothetical protein